MVDPGVPDWLMTSCTRAATIEWSDIPAIMRARAQSDQATAESRRVHAARLPTVALAGMRRPIWPRPFRTAVSIISG
ncbi:hypothetical protein P0F65_22080 [Sphingomonas sp. I4]